MEKFINVSPVTFKFKDDSYEKYTVTFKFKDDSYRRASAVVFPVTKTGYVKDGTRFS